MLERFYRDIVIRGFESGFKRRNTFAHWNELERSQWLSPAELRERQLVALADRFLAGAADLGFPAQQAVAFLKTRWMDLKQEKSDG